MATTAAIQIDEKRLGKITTLKSGSHSGVSRGACVMEAVAYVTRLPWSDHPECVCPVLGAFLRNWNDNLSQEDRDRLLLPLIVKLPGTRGSAALEARRATMAADWFVREHTPAWLRLAGLTDHADALASFPEITSFEHTPAIRPALDAARKDADAAESAAWSAARSAARSAAWSAARSAAWSAAESALEPTRKALQQSALALVERMIAEADPALSPTSTEG